MTWYLYFMRLLRVEIWWQYLKRFPINPFLFGLLEVLFASVCDWPKSVMLLQTQVEWCLKNFHTVSSLDERYLMFELLEFGIDKAYTYWKKLFVLNMRSTPWSKLFVIRWISLYLSQERKLVLKRCRLIKQLHNTFLRFRPYHIWSNHM